LRFSFAREFVAPRRAKPDRARHALALGHAVVGPARREVEHVTGLEQPLLLGLEAGEYLQRLVRDEFARARTRDAPAPLAPSLQQEHVVRIDMRPDTAAVGRK